MGVMAHSDVSLGHLARVCSRGGGSFGSCGPFSMCLVDTSLASSLGPFPLFDTWAMRGSTRAPLAHMTLLPVSTREPCEDRHELLWLTWLVSPPEGGSSREPSGFRRMAHVGGLRATSQVARVAHITPW